VRTKNQRKICEQIGLAMRTAREYADISQKELAAKLGTYSSILCDAENGRRDLSLEKRQLLVKILRPKKKLKDQILACAMCGR
jgi:ribosome-binding protein aMBF1 (putative translation factor)